MSYLEFEVIYHLYPNALGELSSTLEELSAELETWSDQGLSAKAAFLDAKTIAIDRKPYENGALLTQISFDPIELNVPTCRDVVLYLVESAGGWLYTAKLKLELPDDETICIDLLETTPRVVDILQAALAQKPKKPTLEPLSIPADHTGMDMRYDFLTNDIRLAGISQ